MQKQFTVIALVATLLFTAACSTPRAEADILLKAVGKNEISLRPKTMDSRIEIHGQIAQIKTTLIMASELDIQSEADFEYTVPDNTLVTYFAYWYKGEKVAARIVTKERAAEIYRIVTNKDNSPRRPYGDPAIVEMTDKNTFHVRIFPIEANADLKVEIHSVQLLDSDAKGSVFTFPLKAPEKNKGTLEKIHLHLQLHPGSNVTEISNNYNLPLIRSNNIQTLDLQQQNWRAPQDLKVRFSRPVKALNADVYSARAGGANGFFALTLIPSQDIPKPRLEIQGIKIWQLLPAKLAPMKAHQPVLVSGRYSGNGAAKVLLHGYGENGVLTGTAKVLFSSQIAQPNAAAQFWAKLQMQHLAANPKNKSAVMQLSKRFNLPSKYTSWLALPEEGRKVYEKNLANRKLEGYGQELANLIVKRKGNGASAQRLRKLIEEQSKIAETNPDDAVARYLAWQIENVAGDIVREKNDEKTSVKYVQQKQHYLNMLLSYIPNTTNRYIRGNVFDITQTDYRHAVELYVSRIQIDQKDTPSSKALLAHIKRLYAKHPSNNDDGLSVPKEEIRNQARSNVIELIQQILREKAKADSDRLKMQGWNTQLQRLVAETGISTGDIFERANRDALQGSVWNTVSAPPIGGDWNYADKIVIAKEQMPEIGKRLGVSSGKQETIFKNTTAQAVQPLVQKYFSLQTGDGQNDKSIEALHEQLVKIANVMDVPLEDLIDYQARLWARMQVYNVPSQIIAEQAKANPDEDKLSDLTIRLNKAAKILQYKPTSLTDVGYNTWQDSQSDKTAEQYVQDAKFQQVSSAIENTNAILAVEKTLKYPDVEYDQELENKRQKQIKDYSPKTQTALKKQIGFYANWDHSLHVVRDLLLREYRKENPNTMRTQELKSKLVELEKGDWYLSDDAARYTRARNITNPTLYGNLRAQRLELRANREKMEDKIKSESDPAQLQSLNDQRATIMAQQKKLIARMGDPLISVKAEDAESVVALMPDGQIKQLVFDAQTDRWEARFDIPASAVEGQYTIQIIVVHKDGSRQMLKMHYSVDLTPPVGNAQMTVIDKDYSGQKVLRLEVQTDENAARVSALLPWHQKVELMPSENTSNQFYALTPVPEIYGTSTFPVTFVLTDKAHNRAEITVEQTL